MALSEPAKAKPRNRGYNAQWENRFGLVKCGTNTAFCVLCNPPKLVTQFHSTSHEYHFLNFHVEFCQLEESDRISLINRRKAMLTGELPYIDRSKATRLSFVIAREIAREMLPFDCGDPIKNIISAFSDELFNARPNFREEAKNTISSVPLSRNIIASRIQLMSNDIFAQIDDDLQRCDCFSLQLGKSKDVCEQEIVLVFVRMIFPDLTVREEYFGFVLMRDGTSVEQLSKYFQSRRVPLKKMFSLTTDGAITAFNQNGCLDQGYNLYHCIIHQQVLCAKALNINLVINEVITIINFIQKLGLNDSEFKELITDMNKDSASPVNIYYGELWWLHQAKMLARFPTLIPALRECLLRNKKSEWVDKLHNFEWLSFLMYAIDLSVIIDTTIQKLLGKCKVVWNQMKLIRDLEMTLTTIIRLCEINVIDERLYQLKNFYWTTCTEKFNGAMFIKETIPIIAEIQQRFKDFADIETISKIFKNPFDIECDQYNYYHNSLMDAIQRLFRNLVWIQYGELINEFQSLHRDSTIRDVIESGGDMWKSISESKRYPTFLEIYKRILSVFASSYLSKNGSSLLKKIKRSDRARLSHDNLSHLMNLKMSFREPDICRLMS